MQQENNILVLKDVIKGLGANKTTKAMELASAAAPVVAETVEYYMNNIRCISRSGKHSTKLRQFGRCDISCSNIRPNRPI